MILLVLDVFGGVLLMVGLLLLTISIVGVLRMPDTLSQLHAQGVATGPGVIAIFASSVATENAVIITFRSARDRVRRLYLTSIRSCHRDGRPQSRQPARGGIMTDRPARRSRIAALVVADARQS